MAEKKTIPPKTENVKQVSEKALDIKEGTKVKFHYTGKFVTGEVFDSSYARQPLEFSPGKGNIIPGLEKQMLGMKRGEKKNISVEAEEAYGARREDFVKEVPKGPVPEGMTLSKGAIIYLRGPDGQPFPATIVDVKDQTIVLDFNHPLAGKKLIFDVEVMDIA